MKTKMKVGDTVRRINCSHNTMKVGDTGVITKIETKDFIWLDCTPGDVSHTMKNLELIKASKTN